MGVLKYEHNPIVLCRVIILNYLSILEDFFITFVAVKILNRLIAAITIVHKMNLTPKSLEKKKTNGII